MGHPHQNVPHGTAKTSDSAVLPAAAPAGYLDVAALDFVTWQELAARRAWLLDAIGSAGPGPDVQLPGIRAAALALVAVLDELGLRARTYQAAADQQYWCSCGFTCRGLAGLDLHIDQYPLDGQHLEVSQAFLTRGTEDHSAAQARQDTG